MAGVSPALTPAARSCTCPTDVFGSEDTALGQCALFQGFTTYIPQLFATQ
jgi:hypothetical protein